ncbi:MAG: RnfABCDGE type electron transport complex subunit D, partial [Coprobacillus sp.]
MKITLKTTSPNYRQKLSTHRIMRDLSIGLVIIMAYSLYYYYYNFSSNEPMIKAGLIYLVSIAVALATEAIWGLIHKTNPLEQIKNGFPAVTAIIFALTLPIGTPLYVVAIGSFVSIFLGKLVFGGFGNNIFNPALVGRVLVHLSFADKLLPYIDSMKGATGAIDVTSAATPAAMLAGTNWMGGKDFTYQLMDLFTGSHGGALGETCIWLILLVGVILAVRRVFDFRIPVSYLGTVIILSAVYAAMNGLDLLTYPIIHLCIGGVVFGAIFMATDPVTSPSSPLGKILYGIGLGFLTMIIRLKANYPEGVLFSILMMNMLTPLID